MPPTELHALIERLRAEGVDLGELPKLEAELDAVEPDPGMFSHLRSEVAGFATQQWGHLVGEFAESREVLDLIARGVSQGDLSREEEAEVRAQLADLARVVPAGLIALAVEAVPVPGSSVISPWLLSKLGLLPSRWREAHALERLRAEAARLHAEHMDGEAARLEKMADELAHRADVREDVARGAALLTHWDTDRSGDLDDAELEAYAAAVSQVGLFLEQSAESRWYLSYQHQVFGPTRLSEVSRVEVPDDLLTCFEGRTPWVRVTDLLAVNPVVGAGP